MPCRPISFTHLDLNLLRTFDAVMEERSVQRAAQRIFLSQSAVSHSLARLRDLLQDDLFVRTSGGMQPTARALLLAPAVREALRNLELALGTSPFVPMTSRKRFVIAASDFVTMIFVPGLLALLRNEAPHIDIVIRPGTRIDLAEQIDLGRIDAAIGTYSNVPLRLKSQLMFDYDDVLIADAAHDPGEVTLQSLSKLPLVVVSLGSDEDGAVNGFISERGLGRRSDMYDQAALGRAFRPPLSPPRIAVSVPHFLALPALLARSHLIAIVPRLLAKALAGTQPIAIRELPFPTARVDVHAIWHERQDNDPAHHWFRRQIERVIQQVKDQPVQGVPRNLPAAAKVKNVSRPVSRVL